MWPLCKLTSSKVIWTWNALCHTLFNKAKLLIKSDMCMKFYYDIKPLCLETDICRVGLGAALLQMPKGTTCQKDITPDNTILCPITFATKSLTGAELKYSNTEKETLGILHRLKKFHHYCFARKVHIITNHKPLVAIFKKMWQHYHSAYSGILLKSINTGSIFFTNLGLKHLLQTSCHITTTKKGRMNQSEIWV